jgi:hypothetical protein
MWIIPGNKNANVFPLPVAEIPIISLPKRAMGQPWDWMGVAVNMNRTVIKNNGDQITEYRMTYVYQSLA